MRQKFEMTEAQLQMLLEACRSGPLIALQCGMPPSPQERANRAWEALGKEMGFQHMTVEPAPGGQRFFTAIPAAPSPTAALQAGVGRFVACRCVSERDRELCMTKDECSKVYAYSDTAPKEPTK